MLLQRSVDRGGVALLDEPELHLNPAVCKNIIPFLDKTVVEMSDVQVILCTHSSEILSTAFDHPNCSVHHLRSHKDATKIYARDKSEVFDALRRLGTTAAEMLFARGNIFVEGEHDAALLEDGFYDQLLGYKITPLKGRSEVEKEIRTFQDAEKRGELDKPTCFIFDLDRMPSQARSSALVRVLQWDRYCLENYLINKKILFDELSESARTKPESRGSFEALLSDLALSQLYDVVSREIYTQLEPESPHLRPVEIDNKQYDEIAGILSDRLLKIRSELESHDKAVWVPDFITRCKQRDAVLRNQWQEEWVRLCSGKQLIDDIYREFGGNKSKLDFKKRLMRRLKDEQAEEWTLIKSKLRDALG